MYLCVVYILHLYHQSDQHELEQGEENDDDTETDFAATMQKYIDKEMNCLPKKGQDGLKFLSREMSLYEANREKSETLKKVHDALLNIPPTSVSCERIFSIAGGLMPKRRSLLRDGRFDDLVFLKGTHFIITLLHFTNHALQSFNSYRFEIFNHQVEMLHNFPEYQTCSS